MYNVTIICLNYCYYTITNNYPCHVFYDITILLILLQNCNILIHTLVHLKHKINYKDVL